MLPKHLFSLLLLFVSTTLLAALTPETISQQQDILQRQREQQLREQMLPANDVHLNEVNTAIADTVAINNTPCFPIKQVELVGKHSKKFQFALDKGLQQSGFVSGKCLNASDINQIMSLAQNELIGRGYTTSRILVAPQDLNSGKLQLTLMMGYLRSIRVDSSNDKQTHAGRIAAFKNECFQVVQTAF